MDIVLIMSLSVGRFPPPKFFLKKELIWVPFIGLGAWALDMPFMQRYSKQFLQKNPHLKGKDIEATRRSCEKFRTTPTTVVNFVEGSRCTPEKQKEKNSPFRHLLPAKAGGISFTLAAMGEQFTHVLDTTIAYPGHSSNVMLDLLMGRLRRVVINVRAEEISPNLIGDYMNDKIYRQHIQAWLNDTWQAKDDTLDTIKTAANMDSTSQRNR
jgi:1-acyl-sn-glycerol-3-phosphate acyltransferase